MFEVCGVSFYTPPAGSVQCSLLCHDACHQMWLDNVHKDYDPVCYVIPLFATRKRIIDSWWFEDSGRRWWSPRGVIVTPHGTAHDLSVLGACPNSDAERSSLELLQIYRLQHLQIQTPEGL